MTDDTNPTIQVPALKQRVSMEHGYKYLLHKSNDTSDDYSEGVPVWIAECRELDCVADGYSSEKAIKALDDVIAFHLEEYRKTGKTPPPPLP